MNFFEQNAELIEYATIALQDKIRKLQDFGVRATFETYQSELGDLATQRGHIRLKLAASKCMEFNIVSKEVGYDYLEIPTLTNMLNPFVVPNSRSGAELNTVRIAEQIVFSLAKQDGIRLDPLAIYQLAHEAENLAAISLGLFVPKTALQIYSEPERIAG